MNKYNRALHGMNSFIVHRSILALLLVAVVLACAPKVMRPKGNMQRLPNVRTEELEGAYAPKKIALVIGINNFNDREWRPLRYAEKDAQSLASALNDSKKGNFHSVKILTGPENTTRAKIIAEIDMLARMNTNPSDTVVIYLSTHGTLERDATGALRQYIVASDTDFKSIRKTGIEVSWLQSHFGMLKSRRKVIIFATCHSGQGKSELNPLIAAELRRTKAGFFVKPLDTVSEASVMLSACAWGETAREDDRLGHDIYTNFFIEALGKYDANDDGAVTVSEAHDYAREKTYYYSHGQQRATAVSDILGSDPIVLSGKVVRPGKPAIYSYNEQFQNVQIVMDGTPKGRLPGSVIVDPGIHRIKLIMADEKTVLFDHTVAFKVGSRVDAVELVREVHYNQSMGMGVSYRSFMSSSVTNSLYAPVMTYGMIYSRTGPLKNTQWDFGLFGGAAEQTLTIDGVKRKANFTRADLEADLMWEIRQGHFRLAGGPVIGLVFLQRNFKKQEQMSDANQYVVTGLIGPTACFEYSPFRNWTIGLGGDLNIAQLTINSTGRMEMGYAGTLYVKYSLEKRFWNAQRLTSPLQTRREGR